MRHGGAQRACMRDHLNALRSMTTRGPGIPFAEEPFPEEAVLLLQTVVSRKTPLDGRLEIPESLAGRLASTGEPLSVVVGGEEEPVQIEEMSCTCAKAAGGAHVHSFLSSEILKALPVGANVSLAVDVDQGVISIEVDPEEDRGQTPISLEFGV